MPTLKEKFDLKILKSMGCWIWQGTISKDLKQLQYGRIKHKGVQLLAHRVSYELYIGDIPKGIFVLHRCDNPICVNPAHLFLGTHVDNMNDKVSKGRQARCEGITKNRNHASGERHGRAILTEENVIEIRFIADKKHHYGRAELAKRFGVSEAAIKAVKSRKLWKKI